jgi:hypothetical protein
MISRRARTPAGQPAGHRRYSKACSANLKFPAIMFAYG